MGRLQGYLVNGQGRLVNSARSVSKVTAGHSRAVVAGRQVSEVHVNLGIWKENIHCKISQLEWDNIYVLIHKFLNFIHRRTKQNCSQNNFASTLKLSTV